MACLFGHKWNGCKCTRCGKTRNEQHDWKGIKCNLCEKQRYVNECYFNVATEQDTLTDIAKNDKESSNRILAAAMLYDKEFAQKIYTEILSNRSENFSARTSAAAKSTNQKLLEEVVKETFGADNVGRAAKARLLEIGIVNNDKGAINESLAKAAFNNNFTEVLSLLQNGAEINAAFYSNTPAIVWACFNGNKEMATALIKAGADVNKFGAENRTPIMEAAQKGHVDVVELLIKNGADINATDLYGSSALRLAQRKGLSNVV